ncbi:serine/threonine protein phosphatase [Sphingobium sp. AR-3-1]|uniref:Serine/threonine protein phosphatase n=1 Tax=Sphingobium psychrophilum TaxID=2728834 RepID=A0A7X9ZVW7_9SPHN|nr:MULTISPECIES: metallophosphoesterase [Sphingobium]NML12789.1 serine/threonine protein phosphatase [Sphingobium psychrophilum]PBN41939.1 serine/threonine protein phosphatase [Sphingobium sp. D43FB]
MFPVNIFHALRRSNRQGKQRPGLARAAVSPAGQTIYAVGDIHGRLDLLDALIAQLQVDRESIRQFPPLIIFLGDLIDRGPQSAQVLDRLIGLQDQASTRFIQGNHEEVLLRLLDGDPEAARQFARFGGRATALSYGIAPLEYDACTFDDLPALMNRYVPASHRIFLGQMEEMIIIGDYAFVHAGIDPARALAEQLLPRTRWIRAQFTSHPGPFEKMIVHGHSISVDAELLDHRIGLDTGAYRSGLLSAIGLSGHDRWLVQVRSAQQL